MNIRKYLSSDLSELIAMFYNTVHTVNAADYTEEQLNAWTSNLNAEKWGSSLAEHYSLVAVDSGKNSGVRGHRLRACLFGSSLHAQ